MVGTVREVLSRSLKALEEEEIIRVNRNRIVITDEAAMKEKITPSIWEKGHRQMSIFILVLKMGLGSICK